MNSILRPRRLLAKRSADMEQMNELRDQIQQLLDRQAVYDEHMEEMGRGNPVRRTTEYEDIVTVLTTGEQIQLESYRSIPEFSGDKNQYRSWRNQVTRRMQMIENFKTHPKYEAALGIIRAKITGAASDVITNNKTAYNIDAFIARLDSTYADQRPLYIVEAEMTAIKQLNKTLQEYYDEINQALNLVISKITLSYNTLNEQTALVTEAQQKAIRTFIIGLRSQTARNILYGQRPRTLAEALTTAQTIFYDDQYLHLDQYRDSARNKQQGFQKMSSNMPGQMQKPQYGLNLNCNQQQQQSQQRQQQQSFQTRAFNKPEAMDVDNSNRFKQQINWRQQNQQNTPQKRDYDSARQNFPNKMQRINQIQDNETEQQEVYAGDMNGTIPEDLISNASNESVKSSAFLEE